jgi:type I restriction enzyme M protein
MPSKRSVLALLTRDELLAALDQYRMAVPDRRVEDDLVDTLGASHRARLDEVLPALSRDRLKAICRDLGLDDSGREKGVLISRLLGHDGEAAASGATGKAKNPKEPGLAPLVPPASGKLTVDQLERYLWSAADILRGSIGDWLTGAAHRKGLPQPTTHRTWRPGCVRCCGNCRKAVKSLA